MSILLITLSLVSCSNTIGEKQQFGDIIEETPKSSNNDVLSFELPAQTALAEINRNNHTINLEVVYGTGLALLSPAISLPDGAQISPASGEKVNFNSNPVSYRVTAENGSVQVWKVTIAEALSDAKAITEFSFKTEHNPWLVSPVTGIISGATITAELPFATDPASLTAQFTTNGKEVRINSTVQESGTTSNNFTSMLKYTVIAEDSSHLTYDVTVSISANPWQGTQQYGRSYNQQVQHMAIDSEGSLYLAGTTTRQINDTEFAVDDDMLLVKYDYTGTRKWIRILGTENSDRAHGLAIDKNDNIYIIGSTAGNFDGNINDGNNTAFLLKYNSSGDKLLSRLHDGAASAIAIDNNGYLYITGGSDSVDGQPYAGNGDLILEKLDAEGNKIWTRLMGSSESDYGTALTIDSIGNIYVMGSTWGSPDGKTNQGEIDLLLVKYSSSGDKLWTELTGTDKQDIGSHVTLDSSGSICIGGSTEGSFTADSNPGVSALLLVKYNANGERTLLRTLGQTISTHYGAKGITTDRDNNIYLTGRTNYLVCRPGDLEVYLAKYTESGEMEWLRKWGSGNNDYGTAVAADRSGLIYVSGSTMESMDGQPYAGGMDLFLSQYTPEGKRQ
ncbi:MAG: hypothetical protein GY751_15715 [Bacteroidetes bacterium]|nr:hypothetical protein [Bacteroidota bacterium]